MLLLQAVCVDASRVVLSKQLAESTAVLYWRSEKQHLSLAWEERLSAKEITLKKRTLKLRNFIADQKSSVRMMECFHHSILHPAHPVLDH